MTTIPGRNGLLVQPNNRYENVTVAYNIFVVASGIAELRTKIADIEAWLLSAPDGYKILTDTYNPGFLRRAVFYQPIDVGVTLRKLGTATLSFSCYPFRFDTSAYSNATTIAVSGTNLTNPYLFDAAPILRVYNNSSTASTETVTIANSKGTKIWTFNFAESGSYYVEIDSENMTVTKIANNVKTNYSANVTGDGFPMLAPGENTVTFTSGVRFISAIPRWRTL